MIEERSRSEVTPMIKDMLINNMIVKSMDEVLDITWDPILDHSVVKAEVRFKNGTTRNFVVSQ